MSVKARVLGLGLSLLVVTPQVAFAEVMDKELPLEAIWPAALATGIAGFVGWRFAWPVALLAMVGGGIFFLALLGEINDPHVGPAIVREAGQAYVNRAYAALATFVALHASGMALRFHTRKRST